MRILLGSILGITLAGSPLLAHQEPGDKEKPKQQEPKAQEPKKQEPPSQPKANPEKKQEPPPSAKQQKSDEKRQQQDAKQQQKETEKQSKDNEKKSHENNQAPPQRQQNNREYTQASHPKGGRIPPQQFDEKFGSEHHFRVTHLEGGRRFAYSGYAFEVLEPWPSDWSYNDECYIEQDADDYYLVDSYHPGVRVLVIVV